ncbi:MAG TPA: CBS domain-containing protein, partial [archaeon]|nr:CBS domain-containing protein [archaeon]
MPKVKEIMRKAVITVGPERSVSDVAKLLAKNKVGSAVVLRKERPVGIVTAEDIVAVVAKGKNPRTLRVRSLPRKEFVTT